MPLKRGRGPLQKFHAAIGPANSPLDSGGSRPALTSGASFRLTDDLLVNATWSPDGKRILTASEDNTTTVFLFDLTLLLEAVREATISCLSIDQRQEYLLESETDATLAYHACEREHGR